ncbi:hypothetical protein BT63DRAFT_457430 [Microthyrium microscopicum]|uniref:Uncharacterized protein n=1 Tax=Microthyrium microscopicum TaxID=703497 RepID=A0A6A6U2G4_9PEZI|nr:hypothetical protein BT63DRAFT_457430 [Microthyrium microscopicum]
MNGNTDSPTPMAMTHTNPSATTSHRWDQFNEWKHRLDYADGYEPHSPELGWLGSSLCFKVGNDLGRLNLPRADEHQCTIIFNLLQVLEMTTNTRLQKSSIDLAALTFSERHLDLSLRLPPSSPRSPSVVSTVGTATDQIPKSRMGRSQTSHACADE